MSELTKNAKVVIDFEMSKIRAIEEYLLNNNVLFKDLSKHFLTIYACAIYNQRREDIDIIKDEED